jgi:osmotically-inducible protein OsmY
VNEVLAWNADAHGSAISVSVDEGVIILEASVSTTHDRMQVYIVVGNCRGVIDIINEIRVL